MRKKFTLLILTLFMLSAIIPLGGMTAKAAEQVTGLQQTYADENSVQFKWDSVLGVSRYDIQISEDSSNWKKADTSYSSNINIRGLNAGRSYYVRVSVYNENAYSAPLEVTTACEKVKNLRQTTATTNSVTFAWDAAAGATKYQVCGHLNGQDHVLSETTATTCTLNGYSNTEDFPYSIYIKPVRSITTGFTSYWRDTNAHISANRIYDYEIKLVPAKPAAPTISHYYDSSKRVWIDFEKGLYSDGFEYEIYNTKNKLISRGKPRSRYDTVDVKTNEFYKVRMRHYANIGESTTPQYGEWSDYSYYALNPKLSLKKSGSGIKVSWKKNNRATNYTIYASTSLNGTYKKVTTTKKTSYTVKKVNKKKLKKGKRYYFYVVANLKVGKKTYKSNGNLSYSMIK